MGLIKSVLKWGGRGNFAVNWLKDNLEMVNYIKNNAIQLKVKK